MQELHPFHMANTVSEDNSSANLTEKIFGTYSIFSAKRGSLNKYFRFAGIFIVLDNS